MEENDRYDLYHEKKKGWLSKILNLLFFLGFIALIAYGIMLLMGGCESNNETDNTDTDNQTEQTEQVDEDEDNEDSSGNDADDSLIEVESVEISNDPLKRVNFKKVGTVEPFKSATVTSQTSGTIADFDVDEGDKVEESQQIASITDSVATKSALINYETALVSLENSQKSLASTQASVNHDIKMAAIGVETAQVGLQNAIDSYNNAVLTWDEQIKSAMLGVQSAEIGYGGAQETYYNTVASSEVNLEDTVDNTLATLVSGITIVESAAQFAETNTGDDEDLYDEYDDLIDEYQDVRDDKDIYDTLYLIEDILDALAESEDVILDIKDDIDDPTVISSANLMLNSIDSGESGLTMAKQGLNNTLLAYDAQPEGAFTGMESAETGVLSARKAYDIARANQKTQLDALANAIEVSKKQLDTAIAQLENVKAKANLQVVGAETQLAQIEGQADLAEATLEGTSVISPIKGTLLHTYVEEGNYVNPSQTIVEIGDMSKVYIIVSLTAEELKYVKLGQIVNIEAPGEIKKSGRITKVLPTLDPVTKKVQVKILIPNKSQELISGMFTDVSFTDAQKDSVGALVPFKSIIFETSRTYVYVIENNKAVKKEVKLGQIVGSNIEIIDGLALGEKVITNGAKLVNEGDLVKDVSDNQ